jgi:uncharacterized protein (DUF2147 family)
MKKLYILAALLMATTTAHAGNSISFEIGGQKIHVETPKDCDSLSCIKVSAPGLSGFGFKKSSRSQDDDAAPAPKTAAAPVDQASAPQATVAPVSNPVPETIATAPTVLVIKDTVAANPSVAPAPKPAPASTTSAATPTTPLGVWATEENKGSVRIEQCGENLCGVAAKTGEKILINMKPSESKWTGRIHDPDSGRTYDSSMTMKGPNTLRIQGCAGLFCGGQTWTRIS